MTFDMDHWQPRLDELREANHVPGAGLAVLVDGAVHELASGVLHRGTGVPVTTDSVFQLGSVAKIYTSTQVMQLVDEGLLDLDAPIKDVLPDFAVADPEVTKTVTARQLLSHTSGISGDFYYDSGRGDDCLARYLEAVERVGQDCPPGLMVSYSPTGYMILGRLIEVLTGQIWDVALRERLLEPLGAKHTVTLPEDALRFNAAMSHLGEPGRMPDPAPAWNPMPRASGPNGFVVASAGDVVKLARLHLNGGTAADGTRVLSAESVAAMQRRQMDVPDKWTVSADGWGLGWTLYDWHGVAGYGHDGSAIGQYAYLRVVPSAGVAVALVTNGGGAHPLYAALFRELLGELAGVRMPEPFGPAARPPVVDMTPLLGTYRREGVVITVTPGHLRYEFVDTFKDLPPLEAELVPVSGTVFAASAPGFSEDWMPVIFTTLPDGAGCCYVGMRAAPKVA
ncbi:serine hydrolase domain-containing protein [Amycolatopsis anabasis]|uniref:serine hydrolase domain-containing protein n=1 Tax=Amycolatopsis anabasis TaxID=1840409 RepID=UPI00131CFDB6|nr:serine hydrolase domain-containing protein [Amycolatopsis anabasis]